MQKVERHLRLPSGGTQKPRYNVVKVSPDHRTHNPAKLIMKARLNGTCRFGCDKKNALTGRSEMSEESFLFFSFLIASCCRATSLTSSTWSVTLSAINTIGNGTCVQMNRKFKKKKISSNVAGPWQRRVGVEKYWQRVGNVGPRFPRLVPPTNKIRLFCLPARTTSFEVFKASVVSQRRFSHWS